MIKCLVVDDEPLAREGLSDYVNQIEYLYLLGAVNDPIEALNFMNDHQVDLLFLDIQMPKMTGLEFIKSLDRVPNVIITTAYPSFALQGYELNVLDYLVKPITYARFVQAAEKAKKLDELTKSANNKKVESDHFFIKVENNLVKINFKEIQYIKALQNYISIKTDNTTYVSLISMKSILTQLPKNKFVQVHKSYIVNKNEVRSIKGNILVIGNDEVPISRTLKERVVKELTDDSVIKKM